MKRINSGWHLIRLVRLVIGLLVIWQAMKIGDWAPGLFGGLFVLMSLTNTGCCGANGCARKNTITENAHGARAKVADGEQANSL